MGRSSSASAPREFPTSSPSATSVLTLVKAFPGRPAVLVNRVGSRRAMVPLPRLRSLRQVHCHRSAVDEHPPVTAASATLGCRSARFCWITSRAAVQRVASLRSACPAGEQHLSHLVPSPSRAAGKQPLCWTSCSFQLQRHRPREHGVRRPKWRLFSAGVLIG